MINGGREYYRSTHTSGFVGVLENPRNSWKLELKFPNLECHGILFQSLEINGNLVFVFLNN